jgi:hypothetical protein
VCVCQGFSVFAFVCVGLDCVHLIKTRMLFVLPGHEQDMWLQAVSVSFCAVLSNTIKAQCTCICSQHQQTLPAAAALHAGAADAPGLLCYSVIMA